MATDRFEVRVPDEEAAHYREWQEAAKRTRQSLRLWVIAACNAALAPAAPPAARPAPPPARVPAAAAPNPIDRDAWWTAGLWAGRIERAFDAEQPDALSWPDLRRWAAAHPVAARQVDGWAGQQAWGSRWAAIWRSR